MARRGQTNIATQAKAKAQPVTAPEAGQAAQLAQALAACEARGAASAQAPIMRGRAQQVATQSDADPLSIVTEHLGLIPGLAEQGYRDYVPEDAREYLATLLARADQAVSTGAAQAGQGISEHFDRLAEFLAGTRERPGPVSVAIRDAGAATPPAPAAGSTFDAMARDARATIADALAGATDAPSQAALQQGVADLIARSQATMGQSAPAQAIGPDPVLMEADRVLQEMRARRAGRR